MSTLAPPKITPEELLRMPDSQSLELVDGELVEKNVSSLSSAFEIFIGAKLLSFATTGDVARIFSSSLGYQCFPDAPDRIRKPDVTVVKTSRFIALNNLDPGYMPIVPDLAVEVISLNDTVHEINKKLVEYRDAGFPLVWVVDPEFRIITVHPHSGKPYLLTENDDIRCENALPGFVCKVSDLFPPRI